MSRAMYDSVSLGDIPTGAALYLGYVGGAWPNYAALKRREPQAIVVPVAVNASEDATVLDVEYGDATPAEAPRWAQRQRARGQEPTCYMNASTWPAVIAAFRAARIPEPCYLVADYDNDPTIPAGAIGKQYRSTKIPNLDTSIVADHWPGVDKEDNMPLSADDLTKITTIVQQQIANAAPAIVNAVADRITNLEEQLYNGQYHPWLKAIGDAVHAAEPPG